MKNSPGLLPCAAVAGIAATALETFLLVFPGLTGVIPRTLIGLTGAGALILLLSACLLLRRWRTPESEEIQLETVRSYLRMAGVVYLVLDRSGRVTSINPEGCEVLGRREEEILGREWFTAFIPERVRDQVRGIFQAIIEDRLEDAEYAEAPVLRPDGSERTIAWHNAPVRDRSGRLAGTISAGEDITDRNRAQGALLQAANQWRSTVDALSEGLCLLDSEGSVIRCNRAMSELTGKPVAQLVGHTCCEVIHGGNPPAEDCPFALMRETGRPQDITLDRPGRSFRLAAHPVTGPDQEITGAVYLMSDVTERRRAIREMEKNRNLLEQAERLAHVGAFEMDAATRTVTLSPEWRRIHGVREDRLPLDRLLPICHPDDRQTVEKALRGSIDGEDPYDVEHRIINQETGETRIIHAHAEIVRDGEGRATGIYGAAQDVTDRVMAERLLEESEELYDSLLRSARDTVWVATPDCKKLLYMNDAVERMLGRPKDDFYRDSDLWLKMVHPEDRDRVAESVETLPEKESVRVQYRMVRPDGEIRWINDSKHVIRDESGRVFRIGGIATDITEQKTLHEQLAAWDERYRSLFERSRDCVYLHDFDGNFIDANEASLRLLRISREHMLSLNIADILDEDDLRFAREEIRNLAERGYQEELAGYTLTAPDGRRIMVETKSSIIYRDGRPFAVQGIARDVTERKLAEERLRDSEHELRVRNRIAGIFLTSPINRLYADVLDVVLETLESRHGFFGYIDEEGALVCPSMTRDIWERCRMESKSLVFPPESWGGLWGRALREKKPLHSNQPLDPPRGHIPVRRAACMPLVHQDRLIGTICVGNKETDYTEKDLRLLEVISRKVAGILGARLERDREERRRRKSEAEREKVQAQLLQSQKMEAVGALAGGISHDFNNLLSSIQGYADLAMLKTEEDTPVARDLTQIRQTTTRAARLTRQLLLFSRKHPMEVRLLDVTEIVEDMLSMLRRVIGEDINVETALDADVRCVKGDRSNIEQVVMNLAINARDAMPEGGVMSITTENVTLDEEEASLIADARPGSFVCLTVSDQGVGMDAETARRIFEPFFTTKEEGKGTGLGLSVVHGIVKQHEGWIAVDSEPGAGTTFRIYLPVAVGLSEAAGPEESDQTLDRYQGRGQRVLVVEDEDPVRRLVHRVLDENGYEATEAAGAAAALRAFKEAEGSFDLALVDVVLEDANGLELTERLLDMKPDLEVLLNSGYTDDRSHWPEICERGYRFLQKPFTVQGLLRAVRATWEDETETPTDICTPVGEES
jgi:PAS domain S-box-containing protein